MGRGKERQVGRRREGRMGLRPGTRLWPGPEQCLSQRKSLSWDRGLAGHSLRTPGLYWPPGNPHCRRGLSQCGLVSAASSTDSQTLHGQPAAQSPWRRRMRERHPLPGAPLSSRTLCGGSTPGLAGTGPVWAPGSCIRASPAEHLPLLPSWCSCRGQRPGVPASPV